jgi:Alcohol dehydrogenase GroES-like domain
MRASRAASRNNANMTSEATEMNTQLQCMQQGGPSTIVRVPRPALAPDEVLIRQRVIALNLIDVKQRDLGILIPCWPHVLGIEGAGTIEAVGANVRDLQLGDEVVGWEGGGANEISWGGAFQECVAVPTPFVAKKPKSISFEEGASLPYVVPIDARGPHFEQHRLCHGCLCHCRQPRDPAALLAEPIA